MKVLISDVEENFLLDGVKQGFRNDGRKLDEYRQLEYKLNCISTSNGSVRITNGECDFVVVVKFEVFSSVEIENDGESILVNIEFSKNDKENEDECSRISNYISKMCFSDYNFEFLDIIKGNARWKMNIDVLIVAYGGNILDWLSIGLYIALKTSSIPNVTAELSDNNGIKKVNILVKSELGSFNPFPLDKFCLIVTAGYIGSDILWDANLYEKSCCKSLVAMSINDKGECRCMEKIKSSSLNINQFLSYISKGIEMGLTIFKELKAIEN